MGQPGPLFIKPLFREGPKSLSSGLGLGLRWVSPPNNTTLS